MPTLQKRDVKGNPYCDFCATMRFERCQIFDRCVRYNAQAHVKTGRAFTAVRIINYISDKRKWVVEKQSKSFSQLRFCPVCGFDYVRQEEYDGRKYKTPFNINALPYKKDFNR